MKRIVDDIDYMSEALAGLQLLVDPTMPAGRFHVEAFRTIVRRCLGAPTLGRADVKRLQALFRAAADEGPTIAPKSPALSPQPLLQEPP